MKIIFDEGVPRPLANELSGHEVSTVVDQGWSAVKNGQLLSLIEGGSFELFITCDQNMDYQQSLRERAFAIIVLSTNHWPTMRLRVNRICEEIQEARPGRVVNVNCGKFIPRKFR